MTFHRQSVRSMIAALFMTCAAVAVPTTSMATVGQISKPDFAGNWVATLSGVTGCGPSAMHVAIVMDNAGNGTATLTTHGQCGDSVLAGQTFTIFSLNANGSGTAGLSCGPGCGWNLRFHMAPDRQIMNLIDVDPVNPGNYIAGVAVHY